MGTPAAAAAASTGVVGWKPGLVTTSANSAIRAAAADGSRVSSPLSAYGASMVGSSSHRVGTAPNRVSAASTARPVTRAPAIRTGAPGARGSNNSGADRREVLTVEQSYAQTAGDRGEQPEPNDHRRFGPADQLEMMVEGRHAEHPAPGGSKSQDLQDDGGDLGDEQRTQHDGKDLGAAGDRQSRNDAAQGQRPGVP